jgi:hypothetical protein
MNGSDGSISIVVWSMTLQNCDKLVNCTLFIYKAQDWLLMHGITVGVIGITMALLSKLPNLMLDPPSVEM